MIHLVALGLILILAVVIVGFIFWLRFWLHMDVDRGWNSNLCFIMGMGPLIFPTVLLLYSIFYKIVEGAMMQ